MPREYPMTPDLKAAVAFEKSYRMNEGAAKELAAHSDTLSGPERGAQIGFLEKIKQLVAGRRAE